MRESLLERKLVRAIKNKGGMCLKFVSPGTRGVPDRLCLMPSGRLVFVETKAPTGRPTPLQLKRHQELRALGFEVLVIDSEEDLDSVVLDTNR